MNDIAFIECSNGGFVVVDAELFPMLNAERWHRGPGGRAKRTTNTYVNKSGKQHPPALMHRLINNTPKGLETDHINGFQWDNRRCNLRTATGAQNHWNVRKKRGNFTSKFKGVHLCVRKGRRPKWVAQIGSLQIKRKRSIGFYETEMEAALAYDAVAREYFGEYASTNFPL